MKHRLFVKEKRDNSFIRTNYRIISFPSLLITEIITQIQECEEAKGEGEGYNDGHSTSVDIQMHFRL